MLAQVLVHEHQPRGVKAWLRGPPRLPPGVHIRAILLSSAATFLGRPNS
ncbi:MAG: hypothetical protein U1F68_12535 [Gammaproteobacteria bacterium]